MISALTELARGAFAGNRAWAPDLLTQAGATANMALHALGRRAVKRARQAV